MCQSETTNFDLKDETLHKNVQGFVYSAQYGAFANYKLTDKLFGSVPLLDAIDASVRIHDSSSVRRYLRSGRLGTIGSLLNINTKPSRRSPGLRSTGSTSAINFMYFTEKK